MNKYMWRILSGVCILSVLLSALPLMSFVFAAPVKISTANEFIRFMTTDGNAIDPDAEIEITADFELTTSTESDFAGTIHGNGHVITVSSGTALFNTFSGKVYDLGVISTETITNADKYVGVFANVIDGYAENCFAYGEVNIDYTNSSHNSRYVGGFCGSVTEGHSIKNSFACVSIQTTDARGVGGFAGMLRDGAVIESCYSAGDLDADKGIVAGFANIDKGKTVSVTNTYTSCQIVNLSNDAKPSGVNGLYDNQLSLMRESASNSGLKTKDLMLTDQLTDAYVFTSTSYPALNVFYDSKWSERSRDVVALSVTAAAFEDVDPDDRSEPDDMYARADYLTYDSYIDRTNHNSISWSVDNDRFKVYDTVPSTVYSSTQSTSLGGSSSFLRSRYVFSTSESETVTDADKETVLKAETDSLYRLWHLRVADTNPYYPDCDGSSVKPFHIYNKDDLNTVRFYSLHTAASYKICNDFSCGDFDPIVDFNGDFNGDNKTINGIVLQSDRDGDIGLFAGTQQNSYIYDLTLKNVIAEDTSKTKYSGLLIGNANNTKVSNVVICGSSNKGLGDCTGGAIGQATACTLEGILVSVEVDGVTAGGLIGRMVDGTLNTSGVTGFVGSDATTLGGLVGELTGGASVQDCYSTAVVISTASDSKVGGLVGSVTGNSLLTNSYSAALADGETKHPLVGEGAASSDCSYDDRFYGDSSEGISVSGNAWVMTNGYYPQLSRFAGSDLSLASTEEFWYQHYWDDADADDSSTGWIPASFTEPIAVEKLNGMFIPTVYSVETTPGYGFKPASGQLRIALKTTSTDGLAVRYAAARRDDLMPVTYKVVGDASLADDPAAYMEISYNPNDTAWYALQHVSLCDSGFVDGFYDIPKNSKIQVRVHTDDRYDVASVTINGNSLTDTNGCFTSDTVYSSIVEIVVTLEDREAEWGVRRESY